MGRRYRRDYDDDDDGQAGEILTLAWERPVGGFIVSIFILLMGLVVHAHSCSQTTRPPTASSSRSAVHCSRIFYGSFGGMGLVVSAIGFVRDRFR